MLRYKTDFMRHSYVLQQALRKRGGTASIDMGTMEVRARVADRDLLLHPQFVAKLPNGKMLYTPQLSGSTVGFFGWLPYLSRVWPIGRDKLSFKQYVREQGLHTPAWEFGADNVKYNFIIKATQSSFGYGIHGPYSPKDLSDPKTQLKKGEYYEQLIFGRIAKIWYWNERLAAIELFDMPRIKGDGRHTFVELVQQAIGKDVEVPSLLEKITKLQGFAIDDVLPADKEAMGDYRYVSPLNPTIYKNFNVLASLKDTALGAEFDRIGVVLHAGIPTDCLPNTAYSVDAIVDADDKVWLLEMNANPQLHPDIYELMLATLLP